VKEAVTFLKKSNQKTFASAGVGTSIANHKPASLSANRNPWVGKAKRLPTSFITSAI
jgi:hypothetical protein